MDFAFNWPCSRIARACYAIVRGSPRGRRVMEQKRREKTKETRDNFPWRIGEKREAMRERERERGRKARVEKNEREREKERIEREGESRSKRRPVV